MEAQQCLLTAMASLELWDECRKVTAELIHARAQELRLELYEGARGLLQELDGENPALQDHVQDVITFGAEKSFKLFQILPVGVLRERNLVVWREGLGGQLEPLLLSGGPHRAPSTGALLIWKGHCTSIRPKSRRVLSELAEVLQEYPSRVLPIARPRSKLMNMGGGAYAEKTRGTNPHHAGCGEWAGCSLLHHPHHAHAERGGARGTDEDRGIRSQVPAGRGDADDTAAGSEDLTVLAMSDGSIDLNRGCVDCGLRTGNFCDGQELQGGRPCLAAERMPNDVWCAGQRTPFCTNCESRYGLCRFCRGAFGPTPPEWSGPRPPPRGEGPGPGRMVPQECLVCHRVALEVEELSLIHI